MGTHYDLARDGDALRIAIVGQEYGHKPEYVDLDARRNMIADVSATKCRFKAEAGFTARNTHMKGCTNVLRLLLGKDLGSDYEGEFIDLGGQPIHAFNCFALVNFLLCSAVPTECAASESRHPRGKPGRSTRIMQENCARHFVATVEILQPTILVLQGRGVLNWMKRAFEKLSDDVHQTIRVANQSCEVLAFTHPSAHGSSNWGWNDRTHYLLEVVKPAVDQLMKQAKP